MSVKQLSIFAENRPGRLSNISHLLAVNGINIRAMSVADTKDFGILRLIVNDPDKAVAVLREGGCAVTVSHVLAIKLPDRPGGLHGVMKTISDAGINLEYIYCFLSGKTGVAYMICKVADPAAATMLLTAKGAFLASQEDLSEL